MNFLSHFYFDRQSTDPQLILGTVLPDLIKNANKSWIIHPEKRPELFEGDDRMLSILKGWNRHIQVDRSFHSSSFFIEHTGNIRAAIAPLLADSPVRPSFLAHISLELLLDSLLISDKNIYTDDFYKRLKKVNRVVLQNFLELNGISDTLPFFHFFDNFINSEYLKTYNEIDNIMYALNRICMRLWDDPIDEAQKITLGDVFTAYRNRLSENYLEIFQEIHSALDGPGK